MINIILAPSSPYPENISVYESDFNNVHSPRNTFSIAFYIVAILFLILFLILDLENSDFTQLLVWMKISIYDIFNNFHLKIIE